MASQGLFKLPGWVFQAFPTPQSAGASPKANSTGAADKPGAVDRGCLRLRGRAGSGLCLTAGSTASLPRPPLRAFPGRAGPTHWRLRMHLGKDMAAAL